MGDTKPARSDEPTGRMTRQDGQRTGMRPEPSPTPREKESDHGD